MKGKSLFKVSAVIIISALVVTLVFHIYMNSIISKNAELVYPGVDVNGVDISELDRFTATEKLKSHFNIEVYKRKVTYIAEDKEYVLKLKDLNPSFNYDETIDLAMDYGKNLGFYEKYSLIKTPQPKSFQLIIKYDAEPLKALSKKITEEIACEPKNATIKRENGAFVVTEDSKGKTIDYETLVDVSLAHFDKNNVSDVVIKVPIGYTDPTITAAQLNQVNSLVSSYTTNLSGSSPGRITNVQIATNKLSNTLLMPGEEFSFNGSVGQVNSANGYREAKVIINNKLVPGIGGGVCQVSSTLYNAVLRSNILPKERHHHTLPSTYVPIGLDATVSSNYLDYKFVNTLKYPLLITGYVSSNKTVTFNIYSNDTLKSSEYSVYADVTNVIQNKTKYIRDGSMKIGQQVIDSKGTKGYRVNVYLIQKSGGKIVNRTLVYKDYYAPVAKVIKRGTKSVTPTAIKFDNRDPFANE